MKKNSQLIVAEADVLPEVFTKVIEVKKLMAQKGEKSFASACKRVGISRSAYYKYKDSVLQEGSLIFIFFLATVPVFFQAPLAFFTILMPISLPSTKAFLLTELQR